MGCAQGQCRLPSSALAALAVLKTRKGSWWNHARGEAEGGETLYLQIALQEQAAVAARPTRCP